MVTEHDNGHTTSTFQNHSLENTLPEELVISGGMGISEIPECHLLRQMSSQ